MQAGRLRHKITIQSKSVTPNAYGEEVITWGTFVECWAEISPLLGREYLAAAQVQAEITHRVRIRHRDGVYPTMRVLFGSRAFDILSVQQVEERQREIVLMARELIDD